MSNIIDISDRLKAERRCRFGFSRDVIKYFAIICMTLDHIAWIYFETTSVAGEIMHFFGRCTAPIMCFFIAEGFHYTHDRRKYLVRLGIFAAVSQVPFSLLGYTELNMIATLFFSMFALILLNEKRLPGWARYLTAAMAIFTCHFCDWGMYAPLWVLTFHIFRKSKAKKAIVFTLIWAHYYVSVISDYFHALPQNSVPYAFKSSFYALGSLLALPLVLFLYNGEKGRFKANKWFMYVYYPAHLMALWVISEYVLLP